MKERSPATEQCGNEIHHRFSLMLGGPLYQLWRRARLSGDTLELLHRRTLVLLALAWLPLFLLSLLEARAWPGSTALPFLLDIETHIRFLIALPLLLSAELVVHRWTNATVGQFISQGLVPEDARDRFDAAVASALRLRNSITIEIAMLLVVYGVGAGYLWQIHFKPDVSSWYGVLVGMEYSPSLAGWWLGLVSLPLFQFILVRWLYRILIWARLMHQLARLPLQLMPTHPDQSGGLGFLSVMSKGFAPVVLAQSTLLAGFIADRIIFAGATLPEYTVEIVALAVLLNLALLGPLLSFAPGMIRAKMDAMYRYSTLAQRHSREFDRKWLGAQQPAGESLVGSPDISALADMTGAWDNVQGMRWSPVTLRGVMELSALVLVPLAPLMLTMFPLKELIKRLVGILF